MNLFLKRDAKFYAAKVRVLKPQKANFTLHAKLKASNLSASPKLINLKNQIKFDVKITECRQKSARA
ncbi:hypothetical protein [uncultured Campylobacter sp.]|uniref:hypothetical protein n=1 Tax=uncultured Campylobacter sp. TaxID=218934 RepID=UPI00262FB2D8|nr:hypothetical protein [uncultured Campylobacter sp.]